MKGLQPIPETDFTRKLTGLQPESGQRDYSVVRFGGIDVNERAAAGTMRDCYGLTSEEYPALRSKWTDRGVWDIDDAPASVSGKITALYSWNGKFVVVAGDKLLYDGNVIGNVTSGRKQFAVVNTKLVIWPDKKYIDLTDLTLKDLGSEDRLYSARFKDGNTVEGVAGTSRFIGSSFGLPIMDNYPAISITMYPDKDFSERNGQEVFIREIGKNPEAYIGWYMVPIKTSEGYYGLCTKTYHGQGQTPVTNGNPVQTGEWAVLTNVESDYQDQWISGGRYANIKLEAPVYQANEQEVKLENDIRPGDVVELSCDAFPCNNGAYKVKSVRGGTVEFENANLHTGKMYRRLDKVVRIGEWDIDSQETLTGIVIRYSAKKNHYPGEYILADYDAGYYTGKEDCTVMFLDERGMITEECEAWRVSGVTNRNPGYCYGMSWLNITVRRRVPDMDFICSSNNRLWGVSNAVENEVYEDGKRKTFTGRCIYASALGEPGVFFDYSGLSTDSYAVAVASDGDFTAICAYGDDVLCWKEQEMLRVSGSYPAAYYLHSYDFTGVEAGSHKSLVSINETLYYLATDGVYAYNGSTPMLISAGLPRGYTEGMAAEDEEIYVLRAQGQYGTDILNYDTKNRIWLKEKRQAYGVKDMCSEGRKAYYANDYTIKSRGTGDDQETWQAELNPDYGDEAGYYGGVAPGFEGKYYKALYLRGYIGVGELAVRVRFNDGEYRLLKYIDTAEGPDDEVAKRNSRFVLRLPLPHVRADSIQVKLSGSAEIILRDMQVEYYVASRGDGKFGRI